MTMEQDPHEENTGETTEDSNPEANTSEEVKAEPLEDASLVADDSSEPSAEQILHNFEIAHEDSVEAAEPSAEQIIDTFEIAPLDPLDGAEEQTELAMQESLSLVGKIEAIVFASPRPLKAVEIFELIQDQDHTLQDTQEALNELQEFYAGRGGGFSLQYVKRMGYQFQTSPAAKSIMEKQFSSRPRPLSRAALETLAVIAYRQKAAKDKGVTRAEVEFIRGVDAGSIFKTLMERDLIACVGRKEIPGRPMMFGVTGEFLKVFQLGNINDLPPLESFQTPPDIIAKAEEKIEDFEREQAGVDVEEFIGDEVYTEGAGDSPLANLSEGLPDDAPNTGERPLASLEGLPDLQGAVLADDNWDEPIEPILTSDNEDMVHDRREPEGETPQVDIPTGDGVETGSGTLDQ
jgi:segregation and condensation protein B